MSSHPSSRSGRTWRHLLPLRHAIRATAYRRLLAVEQLESRTLLTLPFGAQRDDTAEFMLGDVLVTVVLMESDGSVDANTENWSASAIADVKQTVRDGMTWWEEALALENSVHELNFQFDFTYADSPVATGYEPISRPSNDFSLWVDDFLDEVDYNDNSGFSKDIRGFNHAQRLAYGTDWAFTMFVANSAADSDNKFAAGGDFRQAFAFAGGRFFVMPSTRPASAVAHEAGHMFWALDESFGSKSYFDSRGYYNTQNVNAFDDNPDPDSRVPSIMAKHEDAFASYAISTSAKEMIGWKDSDGDGIFDVLDVPHLLSGVGTFDAATGDYQFNATAQVKTLTNQNTSGLRHEITLSKIDRLQYQIDGGGWIDAREYRLNAVLIDYTIESLDPGEHLIEFRTLDDATGVTSNIFQDTVTVPSGGWHNVVNPFDVDANGFVNALDLLTLIRDVNENGNRLLPTPRPAGETRFLDVNGDGIINPLDVIGVIRELNRIASDDAEGENSKVVTDEPWTVDVAVDDVAVDTVADDVIGDVIGGEGEQLLLDLQPTPWSRLPLISLDPQSLILDTPLLSDQDFLPSSVNDATAFTPAPALTHSVDSITLNLADDVTRLPALLADLKSDLYDQVFELLGRV